MKRNKGIKFATILAVVFFIFVGLGIYGIYYYIIKPAQKITGEIIEQIKKGEIPEVPEFPTIETEISTQVFITHNSSKDCWIVYEGKVYNFTNALIHQNIETFQSYCGKTEGFEEAVKLQYASSSENRVSNFGEYIGVLIE